ncbi:MAG: hypothetical protein D6808_05050 [Candidatus Dadabacteria bacterium]|nr:MAG: hypothetical protein D6808_05050 [Candidatus Dadabacteria bacterium]
MLKKNIFKVLIGVGLILSVLSCGSTNNDQGVSFTFLGYFSEVPDDPSGAVPAGVVGLSAPLSTATGESSASFGGAIVTVAGVQNNLSGQFIRVDRIFMSYNIPGASAQPPDTSAALSILLGPASSSTSSGGDTGTGTEGGGSSGASGSSLPDSFANGSLSNINYAQFMVVPPEIIAWLNFNRAKLPEPPFTMTVTAYLSGVTSAGDRMDTNSVPLFIQFVPDNVIEPTEGSDSSSSSSTSG